MMKAPSEKKGSCPYPTDRGKKSTKRSALTEEKSIALAVEGDRRHDMKLVEPILQHSTVARPEPTDERPQNLCLDKGHDYPQVWEPPEDWGYTAHICSRGEKNEARSKFPANEHGAGPSSGHTPGRVAFDDCLFAGRRRSRATWPCFISLVPRLPFVQLVFSDMHLDKQAGHLVTGAYIL